MSSSSNYSDRTSSNYSDATFLFFSRGKHGSNLAFWHSATTHLKFRYNKVAKSLAREDGNVESALVLIPMLILFLIGVQVIVATNLRNVDLAMAQGDASAGAISHTYQPGDDLIEIGGRFEKIKVLIAHRSHTLPQIVPGLTELMGGAPTTDVVGVAVIEPSND